MPRFQCVDGHRGSANALMSKGVADVSIGKKVQNACPKCGKDVLVIPCNKRAKKVPLANQRSGGTILRKPFTLGIVGTVK